MGWKLFIDDERFPVSDDWVIARSSDEAVALVQANGIPDEIAFDHDLGLDDTSIKFIWWMIDQHLDGVITVPTTLQYSIHSQNPIGAANIKHLMDGFMKDVV